MRPPFLEYLAENVVLFDGGMGTEIYARGVFVNRSYEELNLEDPTLVEAVHRDFIAAGADVVETNTFAANRPRLEPHGLADRIVEVNRQAVRLARSAAGARVYVAGSIGPLGIRLEPWGPTTVGEAESIFAEQVQALVDEGVDLLTVETFSDLVEIQAAIAACRRVAGALPLVAMMTVDEEGRTPEGVPIDWIGQKLDGAGADVIGVNCSVGPAPMLTALEDLAAASSKPLAALPNAGMPRQVEGRSLYLSTPTYMAQYARRFADTGARIVGGCCGTTPEHIAEMRQAIGRVAPREARTRVTVSAPDVSTPIEPLAQMSRSKLARKIHNGRFLTMIEVRPPHGLDVSEILERVDGIAAAGVDAVMVPDNPRSSARLSPLALARLIDESSAVRSAGLEPVLQYSCRDRNLLGMHADLLGAHALGLRNLMLVTGQQPRVGESVWSTTVFDVDAIGLTNVVHRLNCGLDVGDRRIGRPTQFLTLVGVAPGAPDRKEEIRRLQWKVDAGADVILTSPIFDVDALLSFLEAIADLRLPVIATLWPPTSLRDVEYLAEEVPGVDVPKDVVEAMREGEAEGRAIDVSLEITTDLLERLRPHVEGVMIEGPLSKSPRALDLLAAVIGTDVIHRRDFPGRPGIMQEPHGETRQE